MWDKLQITYEGTTKVKETLIGSLVNVYKIFRMIDDENVESMFSRLSNCL